MKNKFRKIFIIVICFVLVFCFAFNIERVYADDDERVKETKTFAGGLGSFFRQIWITLVTIFENSTNGTDETTIFLELSSCSEYVSVYGANRNILSFI